MIWVGVELPAPQQIHWYPDETHALIFSYTKLGSVGFSLLFLYNHVGGGIKWTWDKMDVGLRTSNAQVNAVDSFLTHR